MESAVRVAAAATMQPFAYGAGFGIERREAIWKLEVMANEIWIRMLAAGSPRWCGPAGEVPCPEAGAMR
jgi:hypothetical protein